MAEGYEWEDYKMGSKNGQWVTKMMLKPVTSNGRSKNEVNHEIPYPSLDWIWTGKIRKQSPTVSTQKRYKTSPALGAEQREPQGDKWKALHVSTEVCGGGELKVTKNGQAQNMLEAYSVAVIRSICQLASMSPPVRFLMGCHSNPLWRWGWQCDSSRPSLDRRIQKPLCHLPLYGQRLYGQQASCHFLLSLPWWQWRPNSSTSQVEASLNRRTSCKSPWLGISTAARTVVVLLHVSPLTFTGSTLQFW